MRKPNECDGSLALETCVKFIDEMLDASFAIKGVTGLTINRSVLPVCCTGIISELMEKHYASHWDVRHDSGGVTFLPKSPHRIIVEQAQAIFDREPDVTWKDRHGLSETYDDQRRKPTPVNPTIQLIDQ